MDFLQNQILIYTSKKYENIYVHFKEKYDFSYYKLFLFCASIGSRYNRKSTVVDKGREFRSNYFSNDERQLAYSILINDDNILNKDIDVFNNKDFALESRKILEAYAEGGMDIIVENVFSEKWDGYKLDENYSDYPIDLIEFTMTTIKEVPFWF